MMSVKADSGIFFLKRVNKKTGQTRFFQSIGFLLSWTVRLFPAFYLPGLRRFLQAR